MTVDGQPIINNVYVPGLAPMKAASRSLAAPAMRTRNAGIDNVNVQFVSPTWPHGALAIGGPGTNFSIDVRRG
jgi:hypothetical protein